MGDWKLEAERSQSEKWHRKVKAMWRQILSQLSEKQPTSVEKPRAPLHHWKSIQQTSIIASNRILFFQLLISIHSQWIWRDTRLTMQYIQCQTFKHESPPMSFLEVVLYKCLITTHLPQFRFFTEHTGDPVGLSIDLYIFTWLDTGAIEVTNYLCTHLYSAPSALRQMSSCPVVMVNPAEKLDWNYTIDDEDQLPEMTMVVTWRHPHHHPPDLGCYHTWTVAIGNNIRQFRLTRLILWEKELGIVFKRLSKRKWELQDTRNLTGETIHQMR